MHEHDILSNLNDMTSNDNFIDYPNNSYSYFDISSLSNENNNISREIKNENAFKMETIINENKNKNNEHKINDNNSNFLQCFNMSDQLKHFQQICKN